ncbi:transglutaminase family protein [Leeuwenhoekiella aequorea]|uniref:transglutaminase-like domain-containing protein n=1 Tax=Leeuwenhoekiella aequorea TaxID=283736 RepID=UPI00352C47E5
MDYIIKYRAENKYEAQVNEALWQFLIKPEESADQTIRASEFTNSLGAAVEESTNTYGFEIVRIHPKKPFTEILFEANYLVRKDQTNPFSALDNVVNTEHYAAVESLDFKIRYERFLGSTELTILPSGKIPFVFDKQRSIFDNLQGLNTYIFKNFQFKQQVTTVTTTLEEFINQGQGVCQDFTHLFVAIARANNIPARYTSGYLHQGNGYFGDSQMHAWAECYIPEKGWLGFDPANDLIALQNHIKVAHGKDYNDCAPIKGVIFSNSAKNETNYTVEVIARKESEPDVFHPLQEFEPLPFKQQLDMQLQWQQQQQQQQEQQKQQQTYTPS